jgi:hypothetical protein
MTLFSQRRGLKPIRNVIQTDSMDQELRVSLWNTLSASYWGRVPQGYHLSDGGNIQYLCEVLWSDYFKWPLDTMGRFWYEVYEKIRQYFFSCEWYDAYDFIEFVVGIYPSQPANEIFWTSCNIVLERELSAYRLVGDQITEITAEEEIAEIEEALESSSTLKPVTDHLQRSLALLTNKKSPDYRNSIKESISAVEAICNLVAGNSSATLGQALKELEEQQSVDMHPALKGALEKLYGYTSDADGIRHALLKESNLAFEDAKFMLVSCSTFINYLKAKSAKADIQL